MTEVNVDLAGTIGGTAGDGAADIVIVNGTNGDDIIDVFGAGTSVVGDRAGGAGGHHRTPRARTTRSSSTASAATTSITATTLPAGVIGLTIDGGAGNDTHPRQPGRRRVPRRRPATTSSSATTATTWRFMGAGNDVFQWDPGDGNDTVEGQDGTDTMLFNGVGRRREHRHLRPTAGGRSSSATSRT